MTGVPPIVDTARRLRRAMSLPEVLLWEELRKRPAGLKFRRQHAVDDYVLDFYCTSARLAVEIDGAAHDRGNRPKRDASRDPWLAEQGIRTVRVNAATVLADPAGVAEWLGSLILPAQRGGGAPLRDGGAVARTHFPGPPDRPSTIARAMVPLPASGEDQVAPRAGEDQGSPPCR